MSGEVSSCEAVTYLGPPLSRGLAPAEAGAGFAPAGFAPVGFAPVGFAPVGFAPVGFAPVRGGFVRRSLWG
jgi:hypothetical protein